MNDTPKFQCHEKTVDSACLAEILATGNIPLLTYADERLQISKDRDDRGHINPYVAISHVRRAGLGNETRNALPSFQLSRLQKLARSAGKNSLFWIDTMCVPLQGEYHGTAMERIHQVYENAETVLVLDPYLEGYKFTSHGETLRRIRDSLWKKRLWTLQEGFLARRLCFQLSDRIITLDDLLQGYESEEEFPSLQPQHFAFYPVTKYLQPVLKVVCRDIKSFQALQKSNPEHDYGLDQETLYEILRLGYLASPQYRYLLEDYEKEKISEVLIALGSVYLDPSGMPLENSRRLPREVNLDLRKLQQELKDLRRMQDDEMVKKLGSHVNGSLELKPTHNMPDITTLQPGSASRITPISSLVFCSVHVCVRLYCLTALGLSFISNILSFIQQHSLMPNPASALSRIFSILGYVVITYVYKQAYQPPSQEIGRIYSLF